MTAGNVEKGRFALGAAAELLRYYNDYFGVAYPLPKLDLIALPGGGGFGAMENWGAIVLFERLLLFDPQVASEARRQDIYRTIAHEMAHQWFGNLVTMAWWDDLWLNEGFATWMQNRAADHFHPEWDVWLQARLGTDYAMRIDSRSTTHPIVQRVDTVNQASQAFDGITYSKGQAVIRMIEAFLGETTFRDGVRRYIRAHAYDNATTGDLWAALGDQSGLPVAAVARSFTEQPGLPLVAVEQHCQSGKARIDLRQARFTIHDPRAASQAWTIPVTLARPGRNGPPIKLLLDGAARITVDDCGPIEANAGAVGYYRSAYASPLATALSGALATLAPADRLDLLADGWALVQARRGPVAGYLDMIRRLGDAPERAAWEQVLGSLRAIDWLERGAPGRPAFRRAARLLLAPLFARLGWDERPGEPIANATLRESVIQMLGDLDDPAVIDGARRRFRGYLAGEAELPAGIRDPVLHIVGRYADAESFEQLHRLARQTRDQVSKQQYYRALSSALDPVLAARGLALSLTDELPGALGSFQVARIAYAGENDAQAWGFAQAHLDALTGKLDPMRRYRFVPDLMGAFSDAARADELRRFAAARMPADARREAERVAEDIDFRADEKRWLVPEIDRWVAAQSPGG
jgi:aminopeptidase N